MTLSRANLRRWTIPLRWRLPLAFWALIVSLAWPVVIARELDFSPALLNTYHLGESGLGGPPPVIAVWILSVALTHLAGILWFDCSFNTFRLDEPARFRRAVIVPLAASAFVGACVASYQGLVDVSWLSGSLWPAARRAAGTLLDAPGFGALAAIWTSAFLALAGASPGAALFGVAGFIASWVGLWATGSRTAILCAVLTLALTAWAAVRQRKTMRSRWLMPVGLTAICLIGLVVVLGPWKTVGGIGRERAELPRLSLENVKVYFHDQIWNRGAPVGTVSVMMLTEFPAVGIGVGSYNHLLPDYSYALGYGRFGFDNAQNWYRHQLAELGLVGSLGWLWWLASFGWLLMTTRGAPAGFEASAVKASLVGLAVLSLVGMPTQVPSIALTVWVFAFWYLTLATEAQTRASAAPFPPRGAWWLVVWLVALGYSAETLRVGKASLRPAYRALMADWGYERGWREPTPLEAAESFRWTASHAVSVIQVSAPYLKLTFRAGPPDVPEHPVNVKFAFTVRRREPSMGLADLRLGDRSERIAYATLTDLEPVTWYVRVPTKQKTILVELWINHTWTPSAYGRPDRRALGLAIADWTSVKEPPAGAIVK